MPRGAGWWAWSGPNEALHANLSWMSYAYAVIGSGRQGVALAYDLALHGEADRIVLADQDVGAAERAAARLRRLLPSSRCEFQPRVCDASDANSVKKLLPGIRTTISGAPYRFNALLAESAVACGSSFCDLGGNTAVVRRELDLDGAARARGVSVVPDCGLAPGLCNHLAAHGLGLLQEARAVRIFCGGLPERPVGPLGYKLVFSFEGLLNEYSGFGECLRAGEPCLVPALTEQQDLDFAPLGRLEAAVTSGGTSTCPSSWRGKLDVYEYKTLRWPGHWPVVRALFELGAFEHELLLADGRRLSPREVLRALFEARLEFPEIEDLVVLRVVVEGRDQGRPRTLVYDLLDRADPRTGFSAMERSTAFPAALVAHLQAQGAVAPGAVPLELSVPAQRFYDELARRGISVTLRDSSAAR